VDADDCIVCEMSADVRTGEVEPDVAILCAVEMGGIQDMGLTLCRRHAAVARKCEAMIQARVAAKRAAGCAAGGSSS
jgi:hypothetical protein